MADHTANSEIDAIATELEQLGSVADLLADRLTGKGLDAERAAFHLSNRLGALSKQLDALGSPAI